MPRILIENLDESGSSVTCSKKVEMGARERIIKRYFLKPGESAHMRVNAEGADEDRAVIINQNDNIFG